VLATVVMTTDLATPAQLVLATVVMTTDLSARAGPCSPPW